MLKLSDLALRPDLRLGPVLVSPSRRLVDGLGGQVRLEPTIMRVFLLLLDARGKVVTRDELFDECWGSASVGDDSVNRAIAKIRQIAAKTGPGLFEIETIPRTGYRLIGAIFEDERDGDADAPDTRRFPGNGRISRRLLIGGGLAAATAAGVGLWLRRDRADPRARGPARGGADRSGQAGASRRIAQ